MVSADSKALGVSTPFDWIRIVISLGLLIFSVTIVMALIAEKQTKLSSDVHPAVGYIVLWCGIIWMSMVEGGQASMVGLPPVNPDLYKETHKTTYYITSVGHKGDNLDRYVSAFCVIICSISRCCSRLCRSECLWSVSIFVDRVSVVELDVDLDDCTFHVSATTSDGMIQSMLSTDFLVPSLFGARHSKCFLNVPSPHDFSVVSIPSHIFFFHSCYF